MSLLSPLLFSGSITDLDNEIERLPFNLTGRDCMHTGGRSRIQAGLDELGNWSGKSWIKFSKKMGSLNNQLQKYCVESNSLDSSEEDFEVIVPPKMNINSLYTPVLKSQMRTPAIVEYRFGNYEKAMDHL